MAAILAHSPSTPAMVSLFRRNKPEPTAPDREPNDPSGRRYSVEELAAAFPSPAGASEASDAPPAESGAETRAGHDDAPSGMQHGGGPDPAHEPAATVPACGVADTAGEPAAQPPAA